MQTEETHSQTAGPALADPETELGGGEWGPQTETHLQTAGPLLAETELGCVKWGPTQTHPQTAGPVSVVFHPAVSCGEDDHLCSQCSEGAGTATATQATGQALAETQLAYSPQALAHRKSQQGAGTSSCRSDDDDADPAAAQDHPPGPACLGQVQPTALNGGVSLHPQPGPCWRTAKVPLKWPSVPGNG